MLPMGSVGSSMAAEYIAARAEACPMRTDQDARKRSIGRTLARSLQKPGPQSGCELSTISVAKGLTQVKGENHALDNLRHPVDPVAPRGFRLPRWREPDPSAAGHR